MDAEVYPADGGFSLLGLLVGLAVTSIVLLAALPVYSAYVVRAKVVEGIDMLGAVQPMLSERYYVARTLPDDNESAGLAQPAGYSTANVERLEVLSGGVLEVSYAIAQLGQHRLLQMIPCVEQGQLVWVCHSPPDQGVEEQYLPESCTDTERAASCTRPVVVSANAVAVNLQ